MTERDPGLDPQIAGLLKLLAAGGGKGMHEGTPEQARRQLRVLAVDLRDPASVPEVASVTETVVPGGGGPVAARIYRPPGRGGGQLPTVVFFHGGGWVIGDLDTHDRTCRPLAVRWTPWWSRSTTAWRPSTRSRPPWTTAWRPPRWAAAHAGRLGGDAGRLAVGGDSAGGNLSAVVARCCGTRGSRSSGQLLIYPGDRPAEPTSPSRTEERAGLLPRHARRWPGSRKHYLSGHDDSGRAHDPTDPALAAARGRHRRRTGRRGGEPSSTRCATRARRTPRRSPPRASRCWSRSFAGLIHGFVDMGRHSPAAQAAVERTCELFHAVLHSG